jgi:hypothetical protein
MYSVNLMKALAAMLSVYGVMGVGCFGSGTEGNIDAVTNALTAICNELAGSYDSKESRTQCSLNDPQHNSDNIKWDYTVTSKSSSTTSLTQSDCVTLSRPRHIAPMVG